MATLTEFLTNLADKIRAVSGITGKIVANDFINYLKVNEEGLQQPTVNFNETTHKVEVSYQASVRERDTYVPKDTESLKTSKVFSQQSESLKTLIASNIKKDVTVFGITGTYEGSGNNLGNMNSETLTITIQNPTNYTRTIYVNYFAPGASVPTHKEYTVSKNGNTTDTFSFVSQAPIAFSGSGVANYISAKHTIFVGEDINNAGYQEVDATPFEHLQDAFIAYSLRKDAKVTISFK